MAIASPAGTPATVAVFGATGKQGGAVVDALLEGGAHVRALVRQLESAGARQLSERGVELVYADLDEPDSLVPALSGIDAFFFMTSPGGESGVGPAGETRQGITLADAAAAAGVNHIVFSSVGGAERETGIPHFESKRRVEEHLETLSPRTSFIRPAFFLDNFSFMGVGIESEEIVVRMALPDGIPLQMVAVRDVGVVAAAVMLGTADIPGGSIEIAGDERTGSQIAEAFADYTGRPARYEAVPIGALDGQFDAQAMFQWFVNLPAYRADFERTRAIDPDVYDLPRWLSATDWKPAG